MTLLASPDWKLSVQMDLAAAHPPSDVRAVFQFDVQASVIVEPALFAHLAVGQISRHNGTHRATRRLLYFFSGQPGAVSTQYSPP